MSSFGNGSLELIADSVAEAALRPLQSLMDASVRQRKQEVLSTPHCSPGNSATSTELKALLFGGRQRKGDQLVLDRIEERAVHAAALLHL